MPKKYELRNPDAPASYPQKRKLAVLGYKEAFTSDMTMKMASDLITELTGTTSRVYTKIQKGETKTKVRTRVQAAPSVPEESAHQVTPPVLPPVATPPVQPAAARTKPPLSPMVEELVRILSVLIERSKEPVTVDELCQQMAAIGHWVTVNAIHDAITAVAKNPQSQRYLEFKKYATDAPEKLLPNRRGGRLPSWKIAFSGGRTALVTKKQITLPALGTTGTKLDEIVPELNSFVDTLANTRGNVGRAHSLRNLLQIGITGVRQEHASTEAALTKLIAQIADLSQKVAVITNERKAEPSPEPPSEVDDSS